MNLNQKEKLKQKVDDLEALISCVDQSWFTEHTQIPVSHTAASMFTGLTHICDDDNFLMMTILLRMIKFLITKIKMEIEI